MSMLRCVVLFLALTSVLSVALPVVAVDAQTLKEDKVFCEGEFFGDQKGIALCKSGLLKMHQKTESDYYKQEQRQRAAEERAFEKKRAEGDEMIRQFKSSPLPLGQTQDSITTPDGRVCTKATIFNMNGQAVRTSVSCF